MNLEKVCQVYAFISSLLSDTRVEKELQNLCRVKPQEQKSNSEIYEERNAPIPACGTGVNRIV